MVIEAWYHSASKVIAYTIVNLGGHEIISVCEHLIRLLTGEFLGPPVNQPLNNGGQSFMLQIHSGDRDNWICAVSEFGEPMLARMPCHLC